MEGAKGFIPLASRGEFDKKKITRTGVKRIEKKRAQEDNISGGQFGP